MRILIFGGDGFCGWPTSLHLSALGHEIVIVDNLSRRKIDIELEVSSLTPIKSIGDRLRAWESNTSNKIGYFNFDIARNYHRLFMLLKDFQPDALVHFAEQRAAPYSMKTAWHKRYTVNNNIKATHNILSAIVEAGIDTHVVHLGTMGVYGYSTSGIKIPEGYLRVKVKMENDQYIEKDVLYPSMPGSIYHMTKTLDQMLFSFYNKNDDVRVTDLHQGIVWGTQTKETKMAPELINRFDYDGDYGTVLNRFLMQAAIGHSLTVHGSGGQTRAFIHIQDTVRCIELAINNPPGKGDRVSILNQATETHKIRDIAKIVSQITGVEISRIENPRNEADENELLIENSQFLKLGLNPITLEEGLMSEVFEIAKKYASRCDRSKILCTSLWNTRKK